MTKGHKIALKTAEDRTEIAEKKLFNLKKEKPWEHRGVMAAAEVLGGGGGCTRERKVRPDTGSSGFANQFSRTKEPRT